MLSVPALCRRPMLEDVVNPLNTADIDMLHSRLVIEQTF